MLLAQYPIMSFLPGWLALGWVGRWSHDLSLLWGLNTFVWKEWVDSLLGVKESGVWFSDCIVYVSCGLWENFIVPFEVASEWLSLYFTTIYWFSVLLVWDLKTVNNKGMGFGVAKWVGRDAPRKQVVRTSVWESSACCQGRRKRLVWEWWGGQVEWVRLGIWVETRRWHWSRDLSGRDKLEYWKDRKEGSDGAEEKATKAKRWAGLGSGVPSKPW